jgi:FdhE protein
MPVGLATVGLWDQRIQRASHLAKSYDFAAEILDFYREVASFQRSVFNFLESCEYASAEDPDRLPDVWDSFVLLPRFQPLLRIVEMKGPGPLAQEAKELSEAGPEQWEEVITHFWESKRPEDSAISPGHDFFALALLQPYAEYLSRRARSWANYTLAVCPFCSRRPALGILRPEGDGAKRSLLCSLCFTEWAYRRIICPACEEQGVEQLPIYTASQFEHLRVEACDTCKTYIKTIDLTKDGRAVPIVDELAAIPLTLWAGEKGYSKLQANLLGT